MTHNSYKIFTFVILFGILFLEGYIVLSYELIALRQAIPFAGAGTQKAAIVISAVLLPLAFGYHRGGSYGIQAYDIHRDGIRRRGPVQSIRRKILQNFIIASPFIAIGGSYVFVEFFFDSLNASGINHPYWQLTIFCLIFVVPPIYVLGQTVPLVSNYFARLRLSRATGLILLVSTLGSLAGALVTTLYVMPFFGVHRASAFLMVCLVILCLAICPRRQFAYLIPVGIFFVIGLALNAESTLRAAGIQANNQYHTVQISTFPGPAGQDKKVMLLNRAGASAYNKHDGSKWEYVEFVENHFITPASRRLDRKLDILVIGAGGFTLGSEDETNNYIFIDIDPQLKDISETYLLERELGENKKFFPKPARRFLRDNVQKYDLIFLDAFHGITIPEHLVTREFFEDVKESLKPHGAVVMNFVVSASFRTPLSRNVYATFSDVFWPNSRFILHDFDARIGTGTDDRFPTNVMHVYFDTLGPQDAVIYTDMHNKAPLHIR